MSEESQFLFDTSLISKYFKTSFDSNHYLLKGSFG